MSHLGIVLIGRNEGERLRRGLESVAGRDATVVYVDSNSTDGSVELARGMDVEVVELDLSRPFTAARARNAGFARLEQIDPAVEFVQFMDGDCELAPGWLDLAHRSFEQHPEVAVVCGRRRERDPDSSIYNRLADIEWNSPVGFAKYCGGDALMRVSAFRAVGGFNPTLIAGEEPELCVRLRQEGWKILRIDAEMTLHDMAMTRFGQWWRRCERAGFAYTAGAAMHGRPPERHWAKDVRSIVIWGLAVPLAILLLAWPTRGLSFALALAYPLQVARIAHRHRKIGMSFRDAMLYALACVIGRFPNAIGVVRYILERYRGRRQVLIEYKGSAPA